MAMPADSGGKSQTIRASGKTGIHACYAQWERDLLGIRR
jgi:hypothetical protein